MAQRLGQQLLEALMLSSPSTFGQSTALGALRRRISRNGSRTACILYN